MNAKHTAGPLALTHGTDIIGTENDPENGCVGTVDVAHVYLRTVPGRTEANARRLVACWNALDGISTTEIEAAARSGSIAQALERLIAQRDELLAALNLLKAADFGANVKTAEDEKHMDGVAAFARAAIAKAEARSA